MRRLMKIVAMVTISIGGVLWASPAFAYGPTGPTLSTNITVVAPGGSLIVNGQGYVPGETATLTLFSTGVVLGTTPVNASGGFSVPEVIPSSTALGNHTIMGTGSTGDTASTGIVVALVTPTGIVSTAAAPPLVHLAARWHLPALTLQH